MDTATAITLGTAVLGVALGAGSLSWQMATHVLTGGRVKVSLKVGAIGPGGMALSPANKITFDALQQTMSQGFGQPVIAVEVRSVGRLPVTVTKWSIHADFGPAFIPLHDSIGPPLKHRLDVGESETWALDLSTAMHLADTTIKVFGKGRKTVRLRGVVELGDGRTRSTPELFVVGSQAAEG